LDKFNEAGFRVALTHILFDFFGTLVSYSDSRVEQGYQQSYAVLVDNGYRSTYGAFLTEWDQLYRRFDQESSVSLDEFSMDEACRCFLRQALGREPAPKAVDLFRDVYLSEWNQGVLYIPGVNRMLEALSTDYTLVLVSNTNHAELVENHMQNSGIRPLIDYVVTSVAYGKRKPSRRVFDYALRISDGQKEATLHVGDSYTADYEGALTAGIRCFLIDPERRYNIPARDRLDHIRNLPSTIARLWHPGRPIH